MVPTGVGLQSYKYTRTAGFSSLALNEPTGSFLFNEGLYAQLNTDRLRRKERRKDANKKVKLTT